MIAEIGKAFAMLCGKEDDADFINLGKRMFNLVCEEVSAIIEIFDFIVA